MMTNKEGCVMNINEQETNAKCSKINITPIKAIRKKCMECTDNSYVDIRYCQIEDCPLYKYRMGTNPNRKGIGGVRKKINNNISNSNAKGR